MRVSQVEIEPVLQGVVKELPAVEARWDVAFEELTQDAEGVTATLRAADGSEEQLRCHYDQVRFRHQFDHREGARPKCTADPARAAPV